LIVAIGLSRDYGESLADPRPPVGMSHDPPSRWRQHVREAVLSDRVAFVLNDRDGRHPLLQPTAQPFLFYVCLLPAARAFAPSRGAAPVPGQTARPATPNHLANEGLGIRVSGPTAPISDWSSIRAS